MFVYDSRLKPIRACALMWGVSRNEEKCIGIRVLNRHN
jgi:hypothetical protein